MTRIPKQNKHAKPLLDYIESNPECTINHICRDMGMLRNTVEYNINRLLESGLIYVCDWEILPGRTSPSRMFEIGPGENVPYPHLGKKLSQRRYDRRVRTQQRIAQASAAMGPFAVAAAQVMR